MLDFLTSPIGIILIVLSLIGLIYLLFNLLQSRILFKSSLRGIGKSLISISFLVILYSLTFTIVNSSTIFLNRSNEALQTLISKTNYHQAVINADDGYISQKNLLGKFKNSNSDLWYSELHETMEEMYNIPNSLNDFNDMYDIFKDPNHRPGIKTFDNSDSSENMYFITQFLDIWSYQNENYGEGHPKQTLPYLPFGYKNLATISMALSNDSDKRAIGIRMEPTYNLEQGQMKGANNLINGTNRIVNDPIVHDGKLPNPLDSNLGNSLYNPTKIGIIKEFGDNNAIGIGDKMELKVTMNDLPFSPIPYSNLYTEVSSFIEVSELTYFSPTIFQTIPDYGEQTYALIPYDAFNDMTDIVKNDVKADYQINVTFKEDMESINNGTHLSEISSKNMDLFQKTFSRYMKKNQNIEFYDETNSNEIKEKSLKKSYAQSWEKGGIASGVPLTYQFIDTAKMNNKIIIILFVSINAIFIFMVLRRKILMLSKQIGVLKSLGYSGTKIASSFTSYSIIIVIFGGLISLGTGILLHTHFVNQVMVHFSMTLPPAKISIDVLTMTIGLPLILISLFVWALVFFTIQKPATSLLNNSSVDKPNILVRFSSIITRYLNFTQAYTFKNTVRATGKTFLMFCSILFSSILLTFGVSMSSFASKATKETMSVVNYDKRISNQYPIVASNNSTIDNYKMTTTEENYTFGVWGDYWVPGWVESNPKYDHLYSGPDFDENSVEEIFSIWEYDLLDYMRNTTIERDSTVIMSDLSNSHSFDKTFNNTIRLITDILMNGKSYLLSQDLVFKYPSGLSTKYNKFSLASIFTSFSQIKSKLVANPGTKILFDIYELNDASNEASWNSNYTSVKLVNGEEIQQIGINKIPDPEIIYSNDNFLDKQPFKLKDENQNLNELLKQYPSNSQYAPIIIDKPFSKVYGINKGDRITLQWKEDKADLDDQDAIFIDVEVIGIYDTYGNLGWFTNLNNTKVSEFIRKINNSKYNNWDTKAWYNQTSQPFSMNDLSKGFAPMVPNSPNNTQYSCINSGTIDSSFSLLNKKGGRNQLVQSLFLCDSIKIPKSLIETMASESISFVSDMLGFFIIFSFLIVFLILMVIGNEIIQSSKKEVSTLKALGYTSRTSSKIVLLGQIVLMIASVLLAIPLTLWLLNNLATLFAMNVGIYVNFIPNLFELLLIIGVISGVAVLIYMFGTIIYKYTSQLDSLQRD